MHYNEFTINLHIFYRKTKKNLLESEERRNLFSNLRYVMILSWCIIDAIKHLYVQKLKILKPMEWLFHKKSNITLQHNTCDKNNQQPKPVHQICTSLINFQHSDFIIDQQLFSLFIRILNQIDKRRINFLQIYVF